MINLELMDLLCTVIPLRNIEGCLEKVISVLLWEMILEPIYIYIVLPHWNVVVRVHGLVFDDTKLGIFITGTLLRWKSQSYFNMKLPNLTKM